MKFRKTFLLLLIPLMLILSVAFISACGANGDKGNSNNEGTATPPSIDNSADTEQDGDGEVNNNEKPSESPKKTYDMSNVVFADLTVEYNGQEHSIYATSLPQGVSVTYEGNNKINAGTYTITAHFTGDSVNFNPIPAKTATLTISKATYDMSKVIFADLTVEYDGQKHSIIATNLPTGITATYTNNNQIEIGEYTITAHFTGDSTNYNPIADKTATLSITKPESIINVDGAIIDNFNIFLYVDKDTESVSISNRVSVSKGATWKLYYDILGQIEIPTRIAANLENGNNIFYIVVTSSSGTEVNVYELTIHRSYEIIISYFNENSLLNTAVSYSGELFVATYYPEISGYIFNGWENIDGEPFNSKVLWGDTALHANKTAQTYTVTLDVNGGNALLESIIEVTFDEYYTLPIPLREGYTFIGWFISDGQITDNSGTSYEVWKYTDNQYLLAHWSANRYSLTLNKNDNEAGTVSGDGEYEYDSNVTISANTNDGYNFIGWFDAFDELVSKDETYNFVMGFDTTFVAKWNFYTVNTTTNDTEAGIIVQEYNFQKVTVGTEVTLIAHTNSGYTFVGWFEGENEVTTNLNYTFTMQERNVEFEARWTYYTLTTIVNNPDAGNIVHTFNNTKVTAGDNITLTAQTAQGYTFIGWFEGENTLTTNNTYVFIMPRTNLTYTATWTFYTVTINATEGGSINSNCTVSFNLNGGSGVAPEPQIVSTVQQLKYPTIPTRTDYVFTGWYTSSSCKEIFDFTKPVETDLTVYAGWYRMTGYQHFTFDSFKHNSIENADSMYSGAMFDSSSQATYFYFSALTDGEYSIYYKNSSAGSSYGVYIYIYNETQGVVIRNNSSFSGTSYSCNSFIANAGDVISIRLYRYSLSYYSFIDLYVTGARLPEASGTALNSISKDTPTKITANQQVVLNAETKDGYTFIGWFDGDEILSTSLTYLFTMPEKNIIYEARWIRCPITISKNIDEAGDVFGLEGATCVGEQVTISAVTNAGYTFLGWYEDENLLTSSLSYTFDMTDEFVTYTAKWMLCPVTLDKNIAEAGKVYGVEGATRIGETIIITAETNEGYTFLGWYNENTLISTSPSYSFTLNTTPVTYIAMWTIYTLTTQISDESAGTITTYDRTSVTAGTFITVLATLNEGYNFLGWFNEDLLLTRQLSYTFPMPKVSITYTAKYSSYTITINSTEGGTAMGEVAVANLSFDLNGGDGLAPATQTVTNTQGLVYPTTPSRAGYIFTGWYTSQECSVLFDFSNNINEDTTVFAGWYKILTEGNGNYLLDFRNRYNSSNNPYTVNTSSLGTSSSTANYYYFTSLTSRWYVIYCKNEYYFTGATSSDYYKVYIQIYNMTKNESIYSSSFNEKSYKLLTSFQASAGDVICIRLYRYTPYASSSFNFYIDGAETPVAGGLGSRSIPNKSQISTGRQVTLSAVANEGYSFLGWFKDNDTTPVSTELTCLITMPNSDVSYTAKWARYTLTTQISDEAAGAITPHEATAIVAGNSVTLEATYHDGYTFLGWYNGEVLLTEQSIYTFIMPNESVIYIAKYVTYSLVVANSEGGFVSNHPTITFDLNGGSGQAPEPQILLGNQVITYPDLPQRDRYIFTGWYTTAKCTELFDSSKEIRGNTTVYAGWYKLSTTGDGNYIFDARKYDMNTAYSGRTGGDISSARYYYFTALTSGNYWIYYKNSHSSSSYEFYIYVFNATTGETLLENTICNNISYSSTNFTVDAGTVIGIRMYRASDYQTTFNLYIEGCETPKMGKQVSDFKTATNVTAGTKISLTATTLDGYVFLGWFKDDETEAVSTELTYTFIMSKANVTYIAKWEKIVQSSDFNATVNSLPTYALKYDYIDSDLDEYNSMSGDNYWHHGDGVPTIWKKEN